MPLRAPNPPPTDQRQWDMWTRTVPIVPDNGSVTSVTVADKAITNAKLRDSAPASVIGRLSASPGTPGDIVAAADDTFLARRSGVLGFGPLADADIPAAIARDAEVTAAIAALQVLLSFTGTFTGAFLGTATDPAPVVRYSVSGKLVALYLPQTSATSNATTFAISGAPAAIVPARTQGVMAVVRDNNIVAFGTAVVSSVAGVLTFGLGPTTGGFTNTGTKGVELQTLVYSLD